MEILYDGKGFKYNGIKISRATFDAGYRSSLHAHKDTDEIVYIINGAGSLYVSHEKTKVSKGKITLIKAEVDHLIEGGKKGLECLVIHLYHEKEGKQD